MVSGFEFIYLDLDLLYLIFFTDDLVIFNKATIEQAYLLKRLLQHFCVLSSHKVSARKSNMFFSNGVVKDLRTQISQIFCFLIVSNFGTYLGVPLLHERMTKSTMSFVVNRVRHKLQSWDARKLSIAGRVTLV